MIKIDTARSVVNCYMHTLNVDTEIWRAKSDVRQFSKWLKLILNVSMANDILLNNRSDDEFLQKLASNIELEDVDVFTKLCFVYEKMATIHVDGLVDQVRNALEVEMNDFLDQIMDGVRENIYYAKEEQWKEIKKQLRYSTDEEEASR